MSLAVSVSEVHDFPNFSQGAGFKPVFSFDLFEPVLNFVRMHGQSACPLPFRKNPAI